MKIRKDTMRHRKEEGVKMESGIEVKHLKAKDSQGLTVSTRSYDRGLRQFLCQKLQKESTLPTP